jgi:glycosyltransferase involved in cell wall biosynthesis
MSKPKFEVFLGTYNAAPWITGVIKSLEQQTCDPFTVNIIDNGSTDGTIQIIEELF